MKRSQAILRMPVDMVDAVMILHDGDRSDVLLFVGTVLEPPAAILILTPLLMPLIVQAGVDQIHFGIIFTVNLAIGMFIPPFGLNLFATHALFGIPLGKLYRDILPFIAVYLIALALITYVPAITLAPLQLWR